MRRGFHIFSTYLLSIYYTDIKNRCAQTVEEKNREISSWRKAAREVIVACRVYGWLRIDLKGCCFIRPQVTPERCLQPLNIA